ncbi:MAG: FAD-binding oxidoreductase [Planctomycetota bacterium]|nr:FAD-binding oxidoreductase [Planctomycetota bacterium]
MCLPRGGGCSYGDAAILDQGRLLQLEPHPNEEFHSSSSLVDTERSTVSVSAAVTLRQLLPRLARQGVTLPVVPGVLDATVGGMLAADVHGKNHLRRGSIGEVTSELRLVLPSGEVIDCDRDREPDIFRATIGGMGLTGMILEARLSVIPLLAARAHVQVMATASLEESLDQLDRLASCHEHVAAWLDPTANGSAFGRGIVVGGTMVTADEPGSSDRPSVSTWDLHRGREFPAALGWLMSPTGIRCHNTVRHALAKLGRRDHLWDLGRLLFPLERWSHWKKVYQPAGFHQHQSLIPTAHGRAAIGELLELSNSASCPSSLVVLKKMGKGAGGLSFGAEGLTLTMDFRSEVGVTEILHRCDSLVAEVGGRVYLAKDTTLTPQLVRTMYPQLDQFLRLRSRIDPDRKLNSDLSRRLKI